MVIIEGNTVGLRGPNPLVHEGGIEVINIDVFDKVTVRLVQDNGHLVRTAQVWMMRRHLLSPCEVDLNIVGVDSDAKHLGRFNTVGALPFAAH